MRSSTLLLTAFLTAGAAGVAQAGDGDPATSNLMSGGITIPYDGFLMLDNAPMTGTRTLRFELWDDPTATAAANLRYSETQAVSLFNGQFSAAIGTGTRIGVGTLDEAVLDGDRLYLSMAIQDAGGTFVPLAGRQAIEAVPYSAWSQNAANMSVAGDLSVAGNITGPVNVTGAFATSGGAVTLGGNTQVNGNLQASGGDSRVASVRLRTLLGAPYISSNVASRALTLAGGSTERTVQVESDLVVLGDEEVTGDLHVRANTWTGSCTTTGLQRLSSSSGNSRTCPDGTFVAGVSFNRRGGAQTTSELQFQLTCCPL